MNIKSVTVLFFSVVIVSSIAASVLPSVNALTVRDDFSDRHNSASWGYSNICGDHICKPGEQASHMSLLSSAQRGGVMNLKQIRASAEINQLNMMHKMSGNTNMTEMPMKTMP